MKKNRSNIEWIDKTTFITRCECMDPDHDIIVEVEKDTEWDMITLAMHTQLSLKNTYYNNLWSKLKICWKILTNKKVTFDSEFIFRGYEHTRDFCDGLMDMAVRLKKD